MAAKRLGKPQAKNFIVERKDGRLDPKVDEMLRDLTSRQEQIIERAKAIRKELRNLYLPTDHIDNPYVFTAINTGSQVILVDVGTRGKFAPPIAFGARNMTAAGINPADVDLIMVGRLTHRAAPQS